jgi:4-amino-4-deoxy-L-arabinose transferase-like glycosyltransferase
MRRSWAFGLAALFTAYVGLAAWLPPADDELYYWCWSEELQLSYFDHPPMTAYLIRGSTELFGDSLLAVRLPACLASVIVFGIVAHLTRPRRIVWWFLLTPAFTFGAVLVTPDTPLLLFWALYLAWLVAAQRRLSAYEPIPMWMWALGGVVLGCAGLGKYTAALAVPASFASFLLARRSWRDWFPGFVFHGGLAFLATLPVLFFNAERDFAPMRFQLAHAMEATEGNRFTLAEFVGLQALLVGFLPFVLFPWVLRNARALALDPRLRACGCLFAVPFAVFLYKSCRGPVEGNWALACYLGFWPLAAHWFEQSRRTVVLAATFAVPLGCVLLLTWHTLVPLSVIPPNRDRISRQPARHEAAERVAAAIRAIGEEVPVYTGSYQMTTLLRFHGIPARQCAGVSRASHFTDRPQQLRNEVRAIVVSEGPLPAEQTVGFGPPRVIGSFPVVIRGETTNLYHVLLYARSAGG